MSRLVVADLFQLQRSDGKFDKSQKKLVRPSVKIDSDFVEEFNEDSEQSGKMYVIDLEATKENHRLREVANAEYKEKIEKGSIDPVKFIDALVNAKTKIEKVDLSEMSFEELRKQKLSDLRLEFKGVKANNAGAFVDILEANVKGNTERLTKQPD